MPVYQTRFEIQAPAARVWQVLGDFARYAEWNPQIPYASGALQAGARIALKLALPGRPTLDLGATLGEVRAPALLSWRGHVLAPWFFEGYRRFEITPLSDTAVQVLHVEDVHGLFAPVFALLMDRPVRDSHAALNAALRARAEAAA